jgi:predicted deacylase
MRHLLDALFARKETTPLIMRKVDLGGPSDRVPVAVIRGRRPGTTMLVTGGVDGDEYAGIAAAYALIERFEDGDFSGTLVIVPVVNMPGFRAEMSQNPLDGKFPKYVFPGSSRGTPTERLMHWLVSEYAKGASAWLDLHSGAITEGLRPFLWAFETGVAAIDGTTRQFLRAAAPETAVLEAAAWHSKAATLAGRDCLYAIAESGERGRVTQEDVDRHVGWTLALMGTLGMIEAAADAPHASPTRLLRHVEMVYAPYEGVWRPDAAKSEDVRKGVRLGTCATLDGTARREIFAPSGGTMLWWKETMAMRPGDILAAIGRE